MKKKKNTLTKLDIKELKKVKVTIAFFDGKEKRKETREIYRFV